ncbi:MAG: hypothetical protein ACYCZJ_07290 [Sulfuriferula sp.]
MRLTDTQSATIREEVQRHFGDGVPGGDKEARCPEHSAISPAWLEELLATPEGIDRLESFVGKLSRREIKRNEFC